MFQDLAVVPVLLVLAALGPTSHPSSIAGFGLAVGQALLAIAAILALGRLVLRPLFRSVARTRSPELFVAACLLVVIASGLDQPNGVAMRNGALYVATASRPGTAASRGHDDRSGPPRRRVPDLMA